MIICGERDYNKWETWFSSSSRELEGMDHSTENMVQTWEKAKVSGSFRAAMTMRPMPRIENTAADSTSIAAMPVYMVDISGECISRMNARIRRRRKHIIEVMMMFKLTLSEIHGIPTWSWPFRRDEGGRALVTTVIIANPAKKSQWPINEPLQNEWHGFRAPEEAK
jgi:hypothetical protein